MVCVGGAADLDPVRGAAKAMTEAVQTREWAKFLGSRGQAFDFAKDFSDIEDFEDHVALYAYGDMVHALDFLLENDDDASDDWSSQATGDPGRDLGVVRTVLAEARLDVLALDLTSPDVAQCGCYVTRAMVPELQPLDASYSHRFLGGQRLYDVPLKLGYTTRRTAMEDLNPYPHPYP
jgi:ribosomal protein S12 methylthiotransferase accessory factor